MAEREPYVNSLEVDKYKHGDDFDHWVDLFEMAVGIAHQVNGPDKFEKKQRLCLEWLPLKIDPTTFTLFKNVPANTWATVKAELLRLLTDPRRSTTGSPGATQSCGTERRASTLSKPGSRQK